MDPKVGDWVATPRRGKAVEINALWYNALKLLEGWLNEKEDPYAAVIAEKAHQCKESFNRKFWYEDGRYLYDVVEGPNGENDSACRPNQIIAISLKYPI